MNYKFNIRLKYSLFIIIFTAVLLISLAGFVFINGRNLIFERAGNEITSISRMIKSNIDKEIDDSILELKLFNTQFYNNYIYLPQFIGKFTEKYSSIEFFDPANLKKYSLHASIAFGGDFETVIDSVDLKTIPSTFIINKDYEVIEYDIRNGNRDINIIISSTEISPYYLNASISIDYLIDENIGLIANDPSINTIFHTENGTIIFSKTLEDINKKIDKRILNDESTTHYEVGLPTLGLHLVIVKDLSIELSENKSLIKNIAIFVTLILLIVLIFVGIIARRVTESLNNIRNIATNVAEGDFSGKIIFKRNDELGALIDTFNQMVDKLDFTFRELDSSNQQLQENIEELKRTKNELSRKEKLALIGETVSKISHEIQNKIGGISIWIQNLELYQNSDDTVKMYTSEMKDALQSFLEMLNNFKMFYREQNLDLQKNKLPGLVDKITALYSNELKNRQLDLKINFQNTNIEVLYDSEKMEEVITNIFINSLYYAPKNSEINIEGYCEENTYFLKISNFGPAIHEDDLNKLFQPFFSTKPGGSGLGLAISYNIIKAHNGDISMKNLDTGEVCTIIKIPGIINENSDS